MAKGLALGALLLTVGVLVVSHNAKYKNFLLVYSAVIILVTIRKDIYKSLGELEKIILALLFFLITVNNSSILYNEFIENIESIANCSQLPD